MAETIKIKGKSTTGAPNPSQLEEREVCWVDPDNTAYIKKIDGSIVPFIDIQQGYYTSQYWMEENGSLSNNNRQWSAGNGSTGVVNLPIKDEGEITSLGFHSEILGTSVSIEIMINDIPVSSVTFTSNSVIDLATPVQVFRGDMIGFRTLSVTGTFTDARVTAFESVVIQGLKGEKGNDGASGTNGTPNAYAKVSLSTITNVNAANTDIVFGSVDLDTIGITVNSNLITLPSGAYDLKLIANTFSPSAQRPNQSLTLFVGGTQESLEIGEGYIRRSGNHNNGKITHTDIINTTGGDINYIANPIATTGTVNLTSGKLLIHKIA